MIWCSSADRGLHNLLQIFPDIKKEVPEANLRIFYHFNYGHIENIQPRDYSQHHHVVEMAQRIRYMKDAIKKLKPLGVDHIGSISVNQLIKEFNEASVFAFPCSTVALTEGYSLSTLQSLASFTVPVITSQDCLGSIYRNSGCIMIEAPVENKLKDYTNAVIKALKDKEYADSIINKCREFANKRSWEIITKNLEHIIKND